ncbi:oocyte zinc finger protein XlCOF6 isoform X1 [Bicyclus anynana]|uniref:Oocyte zinc finger protein XlCOF6 isoform X1 n=1 Tax=Bicyclus anynana TaxID=110368 RepID=A0A6J1NKN2_BICAN|nr:oocyte zinc finger protein XlCOF6 isoform X1 [Bicyclus anynana]
MNSQVCVNCYNKKTVNQTDNRLVTESCGHVKCMDCLLHEKFGCEACKRNGCEEEVLVSKPESDAGEKSKTYTVTVEYEEVPRDEQELLKKKKLDISHIKAEENGGKTTYLCTVCKKNFTSRSQVSYHAYCNGQKKPYHCQTCKQSFASQSHYKYHLRTHTQERPFSCEVCGQNFYDLSKLKRHTLKHTKEKKYSCKECSKSFNSLSAVRKHTLTHTDERPFACATCARRFRDSSNYKKHVHKHKRLCQKCGEELPVGKGAEKQHQCSPGATGPRPHPCPRCRKSFHSKKDMRRHAAIHSDSKPYRCKLCPEDRCFRRKDNLERHVRNAHPDCSPSSAYECDLTALQSLTEAGADTYEKSEKTKLEILNPLPPLPQEVINKHIEEANNKESNVNTSVTEVKHNEVSKTSECVVDKKSIIEANNARESVIVEKRPSDCEKKVPSPENEYVHKIRKAIIPLPPIDQEKFRSVQRGHLPDSGTVKPITNMDIYKKILFEKVEKDTTEVIQNPKMHWRRKMEQDIN